MSLVLIVFVIIVLGFAILGARKGFFGALGGIVSLVMGYAAAIYGLKPVANTIKNFTGLDGLVLYFTAGIIAFTLASVLTAMIFNIMEKAISSNTSLSGLSRLGGLVVGASIGVIVGALIVYGISTYQEMYHPQHPDNDTVLVNKTRSLMSRATTTVLDHTYPEATVMGKALVENPAKMSQSIHRVMNNEDIKIALQDPGFQQSLEQGNIDTIRNNPQFKHLATNEDVRYLLTHSNPDDMETALAKHMSTIWQGVQNRRNDERIQAIINDPALQQKLMQEDHMALLRDPRLLELMELLFVPETDSTP